MFTKIHHGIGFLSLIAGLSSVGCYQGDMESTAEAPSNIVREVHLSATKRILFLDRGNGDVRVAEISRLGEAPVVTKMIRETGATPLEIFLSTTREGEDVPELLVENHRTVAAMQGREDLEPRRTEALPSTLETLEWFPRDGATTCDEEGWEGENGAWGDPIDSWDNIFFNSTTEHTNVVSYPKTKTVTQSATWNGGYGSYHTHGACLAGDAGADNKINIKVEIVSNVQTISSDILELPSDNWITYSDYISTNTMQTRSTITNVGNSSASFRHSAAAWVPNPG